MLEKIKCPKCGLSNIELYKLSAVSPRKLPKANCKMFYKCPNPKSKHEFDENDLDK